MRFSRVSSESDARFGQMNKSFDLHVVVFDVDGVFTDGQTWQDAHGQWRRSFSVRDTMGVRALRKAGYRIAVLTASDSDEIKKHFEHVGVDVFIGACADPAEAIQRCMQTLKISAWSKRRIGFVSEDPAGSRSIVLTLGDADVYTSARKGGDGAVLEISNLILQHSHSSSHASGEL